MTSVVKAKLVQRLAAVFENLRPEDVSLSLFRGTGELSNLRTTAQTPSCERARDTARERETEREREGEKEGAAHERWRWALRQGSPRSIWRRCCRRGSPSPPPPAPRSASRCRGQRCAAGPSAS